MKRELVEQGEIRQDRKPAPVAHVIRNLDPQPKPKPKLAPKKTAPPPPPNPLGPAFYTPMGTGDYVLMVPIPKSKLRT